MFGGHGTDPYTGAEILHPRVYRLRQLQLREGVNVHNLSMEHRGLAPITTLHHVSKIVEGSSDSYRVRCCRTCSGLPNLLELGSYADMESALLVNDVHELHNGRLTHLHLLGMDDLRYASMLQVRKRGAAVDVSISDVLAARLVKVGPNAAGVGKPQKAKASKRRDHTRQAATGGGGASTAKAEAAAAAAAETLETSPLPLPLTRESAAPPLAQDRHRHSQVSQQYNPVAAPSAQLSTIAAAEGADGGFGLGRSRNAAAAAATAAAATGDGGMCMPSALQTSLADSSPNTQRTSFDDLAAAAAAGENALPYAPSQAIRPASQALARVHQLVEQVRPMHMHVKGRGHIQIHSHRHRHCHHRLLTIHARRRQPFPSNSSGLT